MAYNLIERKKFLNKACELVKRTLDINQIRGYEHSKILTRYEEFRGQTDTRYFIISTLLDKDKRLQTLRDDKPLVVDHGEAVPEEPIHRHIEGLRKDLEEMLGKGRIDLEGNAIVLKNMWAGLAEKVGYS